MMKAGLVGFGMSGRLLHAPLLRAAGFEIPAVVTSQAGLLQQALPGTRALPDLDALLSMPGLDLIVIASPHHLHAPQAAAALEAGRHVVVDKPMALTLEECDALIELAMRRERVLTVFHNRRWDSDFLCLKALLAEGVLGLPVSYEARWDRHRPEVPHRWREDPAAGGGVLFDLGPHLIDQALQLFGRPEWLQADVLAQRSGAQVDDAFELRLARGALRISLSARCIAADHGLRYRLHGLRASWRKSGLDVQEQQLRDGRLPGDGTWGVEPEAYWGELIGGDGRLERRTAPPPGQWPEFYRRVRAALQSGTAPPVAPIEAREVIEIIAAAQTSSRLGCRINL